MVALLSWNDIKKDIRHLEPTAYYKELLGIAVPASKHNLGPRIDAMTQDDMRGQRAEPDEQSMQPLKRRRLGAGAPLGSFLAQTQLLEEVEVAPADSAHYDQLFNNVAPDETGDGTASIDDLADHAADEEALVTEAEEEPLGAEAAEPNRQEGGAEDQPPASPRSAVSSRSGSHRSSSSASKSSQSRRSKQRKRRSSSILLHPHLVCRAHHPPQILRKDLCNFFWLQRSLQTR